MSPWVWFILWPVVTILPVHRLWLKRWLRYLALGILGTVLAFCTVYTLVVSTYMIWIMILTKLFLTVLEWGLVWMSLSSTWSADQLLKTFRRLTMIGILIFVVILGVFVWQVGMVRDLNNAVYFNTHIEYMPQGTPLFKKEIPDNMLRLTTAELARNIAVRNLGAFGSNVEVLSAHITLYKNRLVWVVTIGRALWSDNKIYGAVLIDANNPEAPPEIVKENFFVGEGLICFPPFQLGGIQGNAYFSVTSNNLYGRAYLTPDENGKWKYVLTATTVDQWSFVSRPIGVYVYNNFGVENFYSIDNLPEFITQPYDENVMEYLVNCWGSHRRGEGFDLWAGGFPFFIPPSNDRVEISDDTRFIVDPDSNEIVAVITVDPIGPVETLAGIFKISRHGIQYYNLRAYEIMSGHQAVNVILSHLPKPSTGEYKGKMPLLYPLNGTYTWFVPIYWEGEEEGHRTIRLAGLGLVQGNDVNHFAITMTSEGYVGASLVSETKRRYLGGETPQQPETRVVTGILKYKFNYIKNGNTVYVLTIQSGNETIDCIVYTEKFSFQVIRQIDELKIGQEISVVINAQNEFCGFS